MVLPKLTVVFCEKCKEPLFTCTEKAKGAKIWHKKCDPRLDLPLPKQPDITAKKVHKHGA